MNVLRASIGYFDALNELQKSIFLCYVEKKYLQENAVYEQKIHQARLCLLAAMKKMRSLANQDTYNRSAQFENLYEIIFSLNTLKLRIVDHATFEICETEFKKISHSLSDMLKHVMLLLKKKNSTDKKTSMSQAAQLLGQFSRQIDALEELYRSALQVVLPEPLFFLFFLQDLMAFRDALESFLLEWLHD